MRSARQAEMLEAMGISRLYSRFPLPGARKSLRPVARREAAAPAVPTPPVPASAPPSFSSLRQTSAAPIASTPSVATRASAEDKKLRLRYRFIQAGSLLMVVEQPSLEWHEAERAHTFFADIHFALTGNDYQRGTEMQFDWPPSRNFPQAGNRQMAFEALGSTLHEEVKKTGASWVLLWGAHLAEPFVGKTPAVGEVVFHGKTPLLPLETLAFYWSQPLQKKLLWQLLQMVKGSHG